MRVDTQLDVPADVTPDELDEAATSATAVPRDVALEVEGGTLVADDTNSLADVVDEVRSQQSTARNSIAPAVLSLVLVALALLMRLLKAASELRVPELALASLRGVTARRLWGLGLAEPLVVLLVAMPLGIGFGVGLVGRAGAQWLVPGLPLPLPWASWVAAALVLARGLRRRVRRGRAGRARHARLPAQRRTTSRGRAPLVGHRPADAGGARRRGAGQEALGRRAGRARRDRPGAAGAARGRGRTGRDPADRGRAATWWTGRSRGRSLSGFVSWRGRSRAARRARW